MFIQITMAAPTNSSNKVACYLTVLTDTKDNTSTFSFTSDPPETQTRATWIKWQFAHVAYAPTYLEARKKILKMIKEFYDYNNHD
jgi:hypothetical protein